MKERLESALQSVDKAALIAHGESITGQRLSMSEPFSAGQYWICFEMVAEDESSMIARVRLPRHPETPARIRDEDVAYATSCEVATMQYVRSKLASIAIPRVTPMSLPTRRVQNKSVLLICL